MTRFLSLLLPVLLSVGVHAQQARKPHPFIPSIPELTDEEEKKIDAVIDRFIEYDTGKLRGAEGQQALREFHKLGPEAIPALIRGLNRAAAINNSCPVTVIAAKLQRFFGSTNDLKMLSFARDEIGVGRTVHAAVIQDIRFYCTTRRNLLVRAGIKPIGPMKPLARTYSTTALIEEIGKEKGDRLRTLLSELGQRNGDEVINALGHSSASYQRENQQVARAALVATLSRLKPDALKQRLTDEKAEVRMAAVKVVSTRKLPWGSELIERLDDEDGNVRIWARETLVRLSKNIVDFGPAPTATKQQREVALRRWREWWQRQGSR